MGGVGRVADGITPAAGGSGRMTGVIRVRPEFRSGPVRQVRSGMGARGRAGSAARVR